MNAYHAPTMIVLSLFLYFFFIFHRFNHISVNDRRRLLVWSPLSMSVAVYISLDVYAVCI